MPFVRIKKCLTCGVAHEWFFDGVDLKEQRMIKRLTGMRAKEFAEAGDAGDPDALAALIVILHARDKIKLGFEDANIDFNDFEMEATDEELAAIAEMEAREAAEAAAGTAAPKE